MISDNVELCKKITSIFPDFVECVTGIDVDSDDEKCSTVIRLLRGNKQVKYLLPDGDAEACMAGR